MQGEAVLGLEAAARALVRPGMTALNLVSGVYAKWFGLWLAEYGAELVEVEVPYDEAVDPAGGGRAPSRTIRRPPWWPWCTRRRRPAC